MKYMNQNIRKLLFRLLIPAVLSVMVLPGAVWAAGSSCSISLPVKVQVSGNNVPAGVPYKIGIERITPEAPMPESDTISIINAGDLSFGPIVYTTAGIYQYRIIQKSEPRTYFTFDQTIYTVTVRIQTAADGSLTSEVWAVAGTSDEKAEAVVFNNRYYRSSGGGGGGGGGGGNSSGTTIKPGVVPMGPGTEAETVIIDENPIAFFDLVKTGDHSFSALLAVVMVSAIILAGGTWILARRSRQLKK